MHVIASAVMLLSFGLSCRINEILGWADYKPTHADFKMDGWTCNFSAGSRSGNGSPRPMYHKILILPPHLVKRLLALVCFIHPELIPCVRGFIAITANFQKIMVESCVADLLSMPADTDGVSERLSLKSIRSISASILPMLHEIYQGIPLHRTVLGSHFSIAARACRTGRLHKALPVQSHHRR